MKKETKTKEKTSKEYIQTICLMHKDCVGCPFKNEDTKKCEAR